MFCRQVTIACPRFTFAAMNMSFVRPRVAQLRRAFTLIELMTVIVVIMILIVMIIPVAEGIREKTEKAKCLANLRGLYLATSGYIQQHAHWPQVDPKGIRSGEYARQWIAELEPFGISRVNWICPSQQRAMGDPDYTNPRNSRVDYIATNFDDQTRTPFKWNTQPWFAERASVHRSGVLMIFSDGVTRELTLSR